MSAYEPAAGNGDQLTGWGACGLPRSGIPGCSVSTALCQVLPGDHGDQRLSSWRPGTLLGRADADDGPCRSGKEGRPAAGLLSVLRGGHESLRGWQQTGTQPCGSQGSWWPPWGPETRSTVSSRQQGDPSSSFSKPRTSTQAASPPVGTRGTRRPRPCSWLAPGCRLPCGLQEGPRAHLRPISQSHTQMFPLVAPGKLSANCRATKRAMSHGSSESVLPRGLEHSTRSPPRPTFPTFPTIPRSQE